MNPQTTALLDALERSRHPEPADLLSAIRGLPLPGALPSPWETWTLIGLVRHRERQFWVADIIRNRLRGTPADLAAMGALGHPQGVPQSGPVPGLPEWEYYFHGRGCCLTHKIDGDRIDVDFWDDSAEYFDTFFYTWYLESLRHPEPPEQRLRDLHRSVRPVRIAVEDLVATGALTPLPGRDAQPPRVSDAVLDHLDAIEAFCAAWANPANRLWLGALCSDWLAAHEAAEGRPDLTAITGPRAAQCRELRRLRLQRDLGEQNKAADALHAIADLGTADIEQCLIDVLSGPPTGAISAALDIIGQQDDPRWCPHLYTLFRRTDPAQQAPCPHIWVTSLRLLVRHGHHTAEVITALPKAGGTVIGEAVLLALEHAPELALSLIRKGLLADIPINRIEVAAILAVIN
jgi:hypothetical protein